MTLTNSAKELAEICGLLSKILVRLDFLKFPLAAIHVSNALANLTDEMQRRSPDGPSAPALDAGFSELD